MECHRETRAASRKLKRRIRKRIRTYNEQMEEETEEAHKRGDFADVWQYGKLRTRRKGAKLRGRMMDRKLEGSGDPGRLWAVSAGGA